MVDALRSYSCVLIGSEDDALEGEEGQAGEGECDGEEGEKKSSRGPVVKSLPSFDVTRGIPNDPRGG